MSGVPKAIVPVGHVAPVPRRVRAILGGITVLDTTRALYLWDWPYYPRFQIPAEDLAADVLIEASVQERDRHGTLVRSDLHAGGIERAGAASRYVSSGTPELVDTICLKWDALDAWFEEDEEVFVHPRSPYVRVDALRSSRNVRVELNGVVLAETSSPVLVFETGLPTRYYFNRTDVEFAHLEPTDTVTSCPYKGRTSRYWSAEIAGRIYRDLAWAYDFPTRQLLPIAGLVAFYNENVDLFVDGHEQPRPTTHLVA
jgi:uncharacterized protein (DUF427 family)